MQKIMEPGFEILYLLGGLILSILILINSKKRLSFIIFGIMGLLLVFGDAFHLVPRIFNSWEIGGENIHVYLGIGKLVTSITMTIFYVLLFHFFKLRYKRHTPICVDISIYTLAIIRIVLCFLPFNEWTSINPPYLWGIYRNIPFVLLGILMVYLTFRWAREYKDQYFKFAYLMISLSFIFYVMTVTLTVVHNLFGLMMLPKTICYVLILVMGLIASKKEKE